MKSLVELAEGLDTDKGTLHSYLEVYDLAFRPLRAKPIVLLEIGVATGGSLRLWRRAFPSAVIHGLDIQPSDVPDLNCVLHEFHQTDRETIDRTWPDESFDVIIDDGSHYLCDQLLSLAYLWPKLKPGGLYFVEDVLTIAHAKFFSAFHPVIYDRTSVKGRPDDVLVMLQKFR